MQALGVFAHTFAPVVKQSTLLEGPPMTRPAPTPSTTHRSARLVALVTAPAAMLLLVAWGLRLQPVGVRPQLVLMAYVGLLMVSASAGAVAIVARMHVAIADAFTAGYKIAHAECRLDFSPAGDGPVRSNSRDMRQALRAVE